MWGMYNRVKADEKHDGDIQKILGSSGDPLLIPYSPLIGIKINFWIWACGVCTIGLRQTRNVMVILKKSRIIM